PVKQERRQALQTALAQWRQAAEQSGSSTSRGGSRAREFLGALDTLIAMLEHGDRRAKLQSFLKNNGFQFPGGTVKDLTQYIVDNNLSLRYGSDAQMALCEFGRDIMRALENRIASSDGKIEHLKAQTPSHDAALKATI